MSDLSSSHRRQSGRLRRWGWRSLVIGLSAGCVVLSFGGWGATSGRVGLTAPSRRGLAGLVDHSAGAPINQLGGHQLFVEARAPRAILGSQQKTARRRSRSIRVLSGETMQRFDVAEPAGVIRLLRVSVPHGTHAELTGAISRVAGVTISTAHSAIPSESCHRRGPVDICTEAVEACPMPAATWHFWLRKLDGPAGEIRLEFLIA